MKIKKFATYTDEATTLPLTIEASTTNAIENYQVYGASTGIGEAAQLGIQLDEPLRGLGDIKDTLDLSTGVLTRRIGVVVLDGTEGQIPDGNTTRYFFNTIASTIIVTSTENQLCSHYSYAVVASTSERAGFRVAQTSMNNTRIAIRSPNTDLDTTEKYRAFYASEYANGRPVTAYYVLANPVTEQVDVPSGLSGTIEGYLTQTGTPTESNPIYPEANGAKLPNGKYEVYADVYKIPLLLESGNLFTETGSGLVQVTDSGAMRFGKSLGKLPAGDYDLSYVRSGQINLFVTFKENGGTYRVSENNPTAFTVLSTDAEIIIRTGYDSDDKTWAELGFTNIVVNQQSNYDLFICAAKLYEDDFLDFDTQKIITNTETTVFTGTENDWAYYGKVEGHDAFYYDYSTTSEFYDLKYLYCADYRTVKYVGPGLTSDKTIRYQFNSVYSQWNINRIYIFDDRFDNLGDFKDYLQGLYSSGDPLIITRQTATSESKDPPVPFPTLTTCLGENTIDVDTTTVPDKVVLTVAAWREIEAKKYANGSWTDIVVRRYENGAWVPSPIPENNIADLQGLLTLLEDHWLPGVNDYRSMILVRTNRNDDTANQLCYMLTCYSTNPSPHFESEFLNNRYWLNDYAVPYRGTDFYLRKFSWSQGGAWVYDGYENNKRDDYFVPIDSNTYNVYLLRIGSSTQYDNNAGYQYFYDLSAYF